jgi:hypothetical protein
LVETLLIVLCVIVFLLAIVVFSPVVIAVDSHDRQVRIRCLFALEFQMPLPGTSGQKSLTVFRRPFPIHQQQPATKVKKEESARTASDGRKPRSKRRTTGRFFVQCLGDSGIRRALVRQLSLLVRRIFRSVQLSGSVSNVSLPDPALNGMLAGALAASNGGRRSATRVNFTGENNLALELRLHPHRVFKAFLFFLPGLPYRAVFRQWRACSAARPH